MCRLTTLIALAFTALLLAIACGGDGQSSAPSPTPSPAAVLPSRTPEPTPTELAKGSGLPAIVDPQELFIADADGGETVLIHSGAGGVGLVAWSPDGTKLAFTAGRDRPTDQKVYVVDVTGEVQAAAEVAGDASVYELLWSPAGDLVAVGANKANLPVERVESKVLLIGLDGGSPVEIYSEESPAHAELELLSWLPGGSNLLAARGADLVAIDTVTAEVSDIALALGDFRRASLSPDGLGVALVVSSQGNGCQFTTAETLVIVSLVDGMRSDLVSGLCRIGDVAWSPDGKEIAYAAFNDGTYALNLASNQTRRLTSIENTPRSEGIEWLADGSGLAIERCWEGCHEAVFAPASGGSEELLATLLGLLGDFGGFAPDARRYLYSDGVVRVGTLGGAVIALTASDAISGYARLSWAPSGDRVAYVRMPNQAARRYSVNVETGEVEWLPPPPVGGAQLSPDGTLWAYGWKDGQRKLWVANADGSDEHLLVDLDVGILAWSPKGHEIAYSAATDGVVGVVNVASGQSRVLANLRDRPGEPIWSPDGSRLAVVAGDETLEVIDLATGINTAVARGMVLGTLEPPQWSPDGSALLFWVLDADDTWDLMLVNFDGSGRQSLVVSPEQELQASWSPDGEEVAFWRVSSEPDIRVKRLYAVSVETGWEREVATFKLSGGPDSPPAWSPDGKRIAVFVGAETGAGIYVVESDGSGMSHVVEGTGRPFADIAWSADGQALIFTSFHIGI